MRLQFAKTFIFTNTCNFTMAMSLGFVFVMLAGIATFDIGDILFLHSDRDISRKNGDTAKMVLPAFTEDEQCGANAVLKTCGPACIATCQNPTLPDYCIQKCVTGCFCKDGFVKNDKGECVRPNQCHKEMSSRCSGNEEFKKCGSVCAPTCANPNPPVVCTKKCIVGCFCKEGFLRNHQGQCVLQRECQDQPDNRKCPENEEFHPCGTACPATCHNPTGTGLCTKECAIGCFCKQGHLRNANDQCVPASNCHDSINGTIIIAVKHSEHVCPTDREIYSRCGAQLDCMASCKVLHNIHSLVTGQLLPQECLQRMCKPTCVCKMPYFRHTNGQCVESNQCNAQ